MLEREEIKQYLPHREPMLLVDRVLDINDDDIVGEKTFREDEFFFQGHFPNEPIVPGVLLVEAMAQAGGIKIIHHLKEQDNTATFSTYFISIDKVKFRRKVKPQELIILKVKQLGMIRHNIVTMQGQCFVDDELVAEAVFTAQIKKKE